VCVLAVLAATPSPGPKLTPGTTTPIADALHWAMLDFVVTLGAAVAAVVQIIAVFRTLASVGHGRKQQAELTRMAHEAYLRQIAVLEYLGLADPVARPPEEPGNL
jgi:hypothetical protein